MPVTLYISAPPASQYQKGATIAIEGEALVDVTVMLDRYLGEKGLGETLIRDIVGSNLARAVLAKPPVDPEQGPQSDTAVGNDQPLATKGQIAAAAKKSGKSIEELEGITVEQAKALLKGDK